MRILIVDDHALVRRGLAYVVKEGFPDADVIEAESAAAALDLLNRSDHVDLALVDVRMPDQDGLELLRALKTEQPEMPVIMLSTYDNAPSPRVIQNLFEEHEASNREHGSSNGRRGEYSLTQREHDILASLAEGRSNRDIAQRLS